MDLPSIPVEQPQPSPNSAPGGEALAFSLKQKSICVVGAGPAGLAALKVILDSPQHKAGLWVAVAFESREKVGGVWNPALPVDDPPLTPLYDSLTTNLPHPIMAFTSYSFPPSTHLFPKAAAVQSYLESYAKHFHLLQHIKFNTGVASVERAEKNWVVKLSSGETRTFDLVIVCNGHYRIPRYPNTPGIGEWLNARKASHSAWYRHPYNLGDTVLVVGAGPSGQDITAEMKAISKTIIHSVTGAPPEDDGNLKKRGRVVRFGENGQVEFEDGIIEKGVDYCILATGYEVSFPFLSSPIMETALPPPIPPLPREVCNSTFSVFPLAKHIFPLQSHFPSNSLAFLGILVRVAPFPLVEAQARAVVRAFADNQALDPTREAVGIISRYEELRAEVGEDPLAIAKAWDRHKGEEQFEYRDALSEFAEAGGPWSLAAESGGTSNGGWGRVRVQDWEKEMYGHKDVLRKVWRQLEEKGEADEWVKGVGEGGPHEWIDLMRKLVKKAEEEGVKVEEADKAKL
ncbi:FAD/NAD(P)-binding domain-containing protein [Cyathus striatus]|nr:FAD/NAD(P)-binding domain-containing protein [Cyathus striatus]